MEFTRAIVRPPGPTFRQGITTAGLGAPDLDLALEQHARYCDALRRCGLDVTVLEPEAEFPDAPFVEDTAVVAGSHAIVTRPGAPSRAGEAATVERALRPMVASISRIEAPGTLDGGDVCDAGDTFYVGVSQRTNAEGARQFGEIVEGLGYRAVTLDVRDVDGALHLKSAMSYLGDGIYVAADEVVSLLGPDAGRILPVDRDEACAANCVRVNDYVLFAAGYPRLEARVAEAGLKPLRLDVSEYRKMDGGLSCLSIRM